MYFAAIIIAILSNSLIAVIFLNNTRAVLCNTQNEFGNFLYLDLD